MNISAGVQGGEAPREKKHFSNFRSIRIYFDCTRRLIFKTEKVNIIPVNNIIIEDICKHFFSLFFANKFDIMQYHIKL